MVWEKIHKIEQPDRTFYLKYNIRNENENVLISNVDVDTTNRETLTKIANNPNDNQFFARITNVKQKRDFGLYVASLPTAGSARDLLETETPNWKEWMKPSDTVFYDVLVRFKSSHYCEWEVRVPKANSIGGLRSSTDENRRYTEDDMAHLISTKSFYPGFKLWNQSQSTLTFARAYLVLAFAYGFVKIQGDVPEHYEPIIIGDVTDT